MKNKVYYILATLLCVLLPACINNTSGLLSPSVRSTEGHDNSDADSRVDFSYTPPYLFDISYDTNTLYPVWTQQGYTYMDESGTLVNPQAVFAGADYFYDGYALVRIEVEDPDGGQFPIDAYFYIDEKLNMAFGEIFETANIFSEGKAAVRGFDGINYIITTSGQRIKCAPSIHLGTSEYSENRLPFYDIETRKYGCLDENGQIVVSPIYSYIWPYNEGIAAVIREGYGPIEYIDLNGNIVLTTEYRMHDGWVNFPSIINGLAAVEAGYIDIEGNLVINSEDARSFSEGRAFAEIDGVWSIIDASGNIIATLDGVWPWPDTRFIDGVAFVMHAGDYTARDGLAMMDCEGNYITDYIFEDVYGFPGNALYEGTYYIPHNGLIQVFMCDKGSVYIDLEGNVIYPSM